MKFCERPYRFIYTDGYAKTGTIVMCPWMSFGVSREIGNIMEDDLHDIWCGERAAALRRTIEDQSFRYCEKMSCPYLENDSLPDLTEDEFHKRAVPLDLPDQFNLAHDLTCNHKCPSCRYEVFCPDKAYKENVREVNRRILPYLNRAKTINACGLGDMFASPYMMELFSKIRLEQEDAYLTLETNGVFSDREHWERLKNLHQCHVTIGVTPNSFERTTYKYLSGGLDDLERVERNLYFLRELRDKKELDSFYITMVIQESNFRELPLFVERALGDFGADQVILRNIYKWNKMTAEDYWFKDVMNPRHPYHRDMLETMNAPILRDPRVYNWTNFNLHPKAEHPAYRHRDYMALTKQIVRAEMGAVTLAGRLKMRGLQSVTLYGDNDLAEIVIALLKKEKFPIDCLLARDVCHAELDGVKIMPMRDYVPNDKDHILITNFMDEKYVRRDLGAMGYDGDLLTIDSLYDKG